MRLSIITLSDHVAWTLLGDTSLIIHFDLLFDRFVFIDGRTQHSLISRVLPICHCIDIGEVVVRPVNYSYLVFVLPIPDAIVREKLSNLIIRIGGSDISMSDNLLGLFFAVHLLSWRQQPVECDLAELLLFEELWYVHAHAKFAMTFLYFVYESWTATGDYLPDGCSSDAISRAKFRLHLEVERLFFRFAFYALSEVEYVSDHVDFALHRLIKED